MLKKICYFLCACFVSIQPILALETTPDKASVIELTDTQFESFMQTAEKPVIIDFWAPWCGPCMKMKPTFEQLANELKEHYLFVSVNIDESQQIAKKYDVRSIPTFKIIENNAVLGTFMGNVTKETFKEHIDNALHKKTTLNTLLSAIQTNNKELVAQCLSHRDIDVNGTTQFNLMDKTFPITPLIAASAGFIYFDNTSLEIINMLLEAGAQIDLEINAPKVDRSKNIVNESKSSARLLAEESAKGPSEEKLLTIDNDAKRQRLLEVKARAVSLVELFQKFNPKK